MNTADATTLRRSYPRADWNETHISYVLLTKHWAYKIMKSVRLPFLDFSTLELRKRNCDEEVRLNRRLAPNVYRDVVAVARQGDRLLLESQEGSVLDYAVKMKRLEEQRLMSNRLAKQQVTGQHIHRLAEIVARFHAQAPAVRQPGSLSDFADTFNELGEQVNWVQEHLGETYADTVSHAIALSDQFLQKYRAVMGKRQASGLVRDVHGDLHSHNIFLYDEPIIFDCISFSAELRQIDLLNEVAFMSMDLETQGVPELSQTFYERYIQQMQQQGMKNVANEALFTYFKLYRANVRVKVSVIDAQEKEAASSEGASDASEIKPYLELMKQYFTELK